MKKMLTCTLVTNTSISSIKKWEEIKIIGLIRCSTCQMMLWPNAIGLLNSVRKNFLYLELMPVRLKKNPLGWTSACRSTSFANSSISTWELFWKLSKETPRSKRERGSFRQISSIYPGGILCFKNWKSGDITPIKWEKLEERIALRGHRSSLTNSKRSCLSLIGP